MAFHRTAIPATVPQDTPLQGVAFKGTLAQLLDLQLHYELQNRVVSAAGSQGRNIECVLKCGGDSCEQPVLREVSASEAISRPEDENMQSPEDALPGTEQDLPMLIGGPRKKTPDEIRAAEAASRYTVAKRCNCLTHRKRASWSPSSPHEASKRQKKAETAVKSPDSKEVDGLGSKIPATSKAHRNSGQYGSHRASQASAYELYAINQTEVVQPTIQDIDLYCGIKLSRLEGYQRLGNSALSNLRNGQKNDWKGPL